jgi:hypothetical protein
MQKFEDEFYAPELTVIDLNKDQPHILVQFYTSYLNKNQQQRKYQTGNGKIKALFEDGCFG